MKLFKETLESIVKTNPAMGEETQKRLDNLTKPPGSLGVLEKIVVQLAQIQENPLPTLGDKVVMTMAGDHGVVEEGVSAFPQEVTPQMVLNFLYNGAAINVLSNHAGARVVVTDVGVAGEPIDHPDLNNCRVRPGTRNMAKGPAMTEEEAVAAIEVGIKLVNEEIDKGAALIGTGEMGIGNTTPSSAILACFSGKDVEFITGRGTGVDDHGLIKKQQVIKKALEVNNPDPTDALDVLKKVGGLEIAALTGVILGASARRVPVVIDGFISTAAALVAYNMKKECKEYMLASHLSQEPGHKIMLDFMGLQPVLYLDLRLGEGTGAALAFHLIEAAVKIIHEMATFEEAGVSNKE
ncbi:nicotinate-nucleotide--dimethylbenzimidazole phosphoribosyltransferase [Desulfitibacter alkalitolerans]|uniref:nicotinate-nucleotide--dimethylbenzimidazole phosphoribosyltransferase n=1 Tax=Desulfitibacter alkalitolerans TaxID=264641 RepID=UPI0004861521|nr:nicotinate-nucleotide--dimethylbenzimidazole phosphoribosyltransferase [Desulfitibacter alkalitolerans]